MQQSSRSQHPVGSLLLLSRFSHTVTTVNSHAQLVWTHINGDGDLFCEMTKVVGSELSQPSLILKVIHDGKTLEQLDLGMHVDVFEKEPRSSQNNTDSKPNFAVMVKLPCIAIKYLQDNTHLRRFQVKFTQDCDYYTALSMISSIDCPMADGTLPSSRGPTTAQILNNPPRGMGPMITPESNAPGPFTHMARTASGLETLASNAPSTSSTKIYQPVSGASGALQDSITMQSQSASNETTFRRGPLGINPQPGPATSQRVLSRQSTGPIYHDKELNQMLPPKRDLPFLKPKSKMSRADTSSLKSSQQVIPESSYPEPIMKRNESSMSELQSQQLIQTQPYPETMEPSQISSHIHATLPYPGANTQTQQSVTESSSAAPMGTSVEEQLSQYLKSPTPARSAFLSTWMCELIQDDDFVTLCEDVEGTWRRFAFGMKP
ncbi:uncharacterized protein N7496_003190 [Penicillium cataractarum]|uniref:Uncharacterized protein n=1 Tax=Penicillium cataractarum TaxID=2100454 RepID=A0A9W9SM19_9EURO|nr:uncharacterized protein N7496_003190 [Penicillium cataractarum]KAJ5380762.1 hypothetical protein N7496_003190 [Penicillium cataractarum]